MSERAVEIWRRKLEFLESEYAIATAPSVRFQLQEQIKEAKAKIAELEGQMKEAKAKIAELEGRAHQASMPFDSPADAASTGEDQSETGTFAWLHLTDLHWGLKNQVHLWPQIREPFFDDLANLHNECGPWRAVLFSGDFVQRGDADEFRQLGDQVLGPLWDALGKLGSGNAVLLAVPGNHDLQRPQLEEAGELESALHWLLEPDLFEKVANRFFDRSDSNERRVIEQAFANYSAWWKRSPHRQNQPIQDGVLPGDFSTVFELDGGFRVGVLGLNTTFLQLADGDYTGKLAWDVRQLHAACLPDGPAWAKQNDVNLLMTHQGPDWLQKHARDQGFSEINASARFALHLFGHMHEEVIRGETTRGGPMRRYWQGNSLFSLESMPGREAERRHGYSAGSLTFSADHALLRHWPRRAVDPKNGWRFVPDYEYCVLEGEATKPERIELLRGKRSI